MRRGGKLDAEHSGKRRSLSRDLNGTVVHIFLSFSIYVCLIFFLLLTEVESHYALGL